MDKHICTIENAPKFWEWIQTRGGIAVWQSVNLSNAGASWSTPAMSKEGLPTEKPTWESDSKPSRIIKDAGEVMVSIDKEVKRFHVAIRRGQCFNFKCTDASSRKIRQACEKAGDGSYHMFDYETQEAVIMAPDKQMSLQEWHDAQ